MSRFEELPPDQQAVLSLLVRQGRTYAQVAGVLAIDETAVQRRARDAAGGLGGGAPRELDAEERGQIADYLLGQLTEADRIQTLMVLEDSDAARRWARAIAGELAPVASVGLPTVPDDPAREPRSRPESPRTGPPRARPSRPEPEPEEHLLDESEHAEDDVEPQRLALASSAPSERPPREPRREADRGGGVLLLAAVFVIAAIVVFIANSGGSSNAARGPIPASAATSTTSTTSTTSGTTSTNSDILAEVKMSPTTAGSKASGAVAVVKNGSTLEIAFSAAGLPSPGTGHYVLWLYESSTKYEALGEVQSVSSNGSVGPLAVALPSDASDYHGVILTLDSSNSATSPGQVVLAGTSSSAL